MTDHLHIADFWTSLDDGKVRCDLCPRLCVLKNGQRGFCFVRQNIEGKLVLTTYGRTSGFAVDPIEKKPLYHFFPGSKILSFGTAGCNLGCLFCQNWDLSRSRDMERIHTSASPEEISRLAVANNCPSVAFTYNDPVIFAEYAMDTAEACHKSGIKTVAVSAGYISESAREKFFPVMDAANVDLKSFSDQFYKKYCSAKLQPVLDTLFYLKQKTHVWLEITTLIIPGENDSDQELHGLTEWVADNLGTEVPIHFSAFHPAYKFNHKPHTLLTSVLHAREIAHSKKLKYVYCGNVGDAQSSSTYCPGCGTKLIERDFDGIKINTMKNGKCMSCGGKIPGFFSAFQPGTF